MTDAELKPCPFCGKENQTWASVLDGRTLGCSKCGARFTQFNGPPDNTAEDRLIALWNTRAPSPAAVTVKPLAFQTDHGENYRIFYADTPIGRFAYGTDNKGQSYWQDNTPMDQGKDVASELIAEKKAQEAYETAIMQTDIFKSLIVTPAPVAGWRDMDSAPDWEGFGRAMVEDWPTGDIEGSFLFDMALKYGLIKEIPGGYDPDQHEDVYGISPEDGDPWYEYSFGSEPAPGQPATEGPDACGGSGDG